MTGRRATRQARAAAPQGLLPPSRIRLVGGIRPRQTGQSRHHRTGPRRDKSSQPPLLRPPLADAFRTPAAEPPDAAVSGVVTPERAAARPTVAHPEPDEPDELAPDAPEVPDVSARPFPGSTRIAAPTPSDTASAPTRPTYADELARPGRGDTFPPDPISRGRTSLPRLRLSASADWVLVAISRPRLISFRPPWKVPRTRSNVRPSEK